jgi:hypothetical protein
LLAAQLVCAPRLTKHLVQSWGAGQQRIYLVSLFLVNCVKHVVGIVSLPYSSYIFFEIQS